MNFWAEPDTNHAASLMKQVYENRENAMKIAEKGYQFVKEDMSPENVGKKILNRINSIAQFSKTSIIRE